VIEQIFTTGGARLNRVAIKGRKQGVYSAVIHIKAQGREIELDCRPSDAIALAICQRVPIYVSERLLSVGHVIKMKSGDEDPYKTWLQNLNPDFFKYKM